ncbi:MAG: bifunctional hydroxymethylpyrimidine kinase/phosphomethylpyrimidine kinase [Acidaminococcales bacterium]|jgi:hydroxymethylpyrimidine/phosphomethylpyrimidine kinase|nr:bifunctional hydroxymethylpyrimidine kinase/phosphomethylpyrimidine kinase [Acidaminococcales bacterium]
MKKVLSIAGSDCSGGAGVQADLKTFSALGVFGMSVIVSVVAENTTRVIGIQDVTPDMVEKQIDAVFEDIGADAVKVGMLSSAECMAATAKKLLFYAPEHVVIDPVMYAKGGAPLMREDAVSFFVRAVLPLADVLTPNIPEAEALAGLKIKNPADMRKAAEIIHGMGCKNVIVKGGHAAGDADDVLFDGARHYSFSGERINTQNTHGTGCTYSSALAACLALGHGVREAAAKAKEYVTDAIRHAPDIGKGHGPVHHFYDLYAKAGVLKRN